MKKCCKCKVLKPHSAFSVGKSNPDGLQYRCKQCSKEYACMTTNKTKPENAGLAVGYSDELAGWCVYKTKENSIFMERVGNVADTWYLATLELNKVKAANVQIA